MLVVTVSCMRCAAHLHACDSSIARTGPIPTVPHATPFLYRTTASPHLFKCTRTLASRVTALAVSYISFLHSAVPLSALRARALHDLARAEASLHEREDRHPYEADRGGVGDAPVGGHEPEADETRRHPERPAAARGVG